MTATDNPKVSTVLRTLTWIEVAVVGAAAGMYTFPSLVIPFWPWALTPFNAFFVGATYFGAWIPLFIFAWVGRWNPGRVVLPMIGVFTLYVLIISLIAPGSYLWDRFGTYVWWALYIILPISSFVHLWLYRSWAPVAASATPGTLKTLFGIQALVSLVIGLGLFISPLGTTTWWPWPIDEFNGRVYGAAFLTLATGSIVLFRSSSRHELMTLGATGLTFGLTSAVGLVKTDLGLGRVDWSAPGTIAWEALFIVITLAGIVTILSGALQRQPVSQPAQG